MANHCVLSNTWYRTWWLDRWYSRDRISCLFLF